MADGYSAYWLHLAVLGNARQRPRSIENDTYEPRRAVIRWIEPGGLPYAIVEDFSRCRRTSVTASMLSPVSIRRPSFSVGGRPLAGHDGGSAPYCFSNTIVRSISPCGDAMYATALVNVRPSSDIVDLVGELQADGVHGGVHHDRIAVPHGQSLDLGAVGLE